MSVWKMGTTCAVLALALAGCAEATGPETASGVGGDPITIDTGSTATTATGGTGGDGSGGTGGKGGTGGAPATTTTSSSTGYFHEDLTALCQGTWGTAVVQQCCAEAGWWPDTCTKPKCGGVITCSGEIDPEVPYCECPQGKCFDRDVGCVDAG